MRFRTTLLLAGFLVLFSLVYYFLETREVRKQDETKLVPFQRGLDGRGDEEDFFLSGTPGVGRETGRHGAADFQGEGLVFVLELSGQDNGGILEAELADILLGL